MKKIISISLALVISLSAMAQNFSAELSGGLGLDVGSKYNAQLSLIYGIDLGSHFQVGVGAGFRYSEMLDGEWTIETTSTDVYQTEFTVPAFLRLKYAFKDADASPFLQVDGGYAFGVGGKLADDGQVVLPKDKQNHIPVFDPKTRGLFYEPQIGYNFSSTAYASIGLQMQRYDEYHFILTGIDAKDEDWNNQYVGNEKIYPNWAGAITFHIGFRF